MNKSKERSWIEINTKNLEYNINQIKNWKPIFGVFLIYQKNG